MKNQIKHKYVPCELRVAQFNVEHEFAVNSGFSINPVGTSLLMNDTPDRDGHYQNQQYEEDIFNWGASTTSLPGSDINR